MESCDALIVGGGPAGSSCARRLREAGLDVLVLDKARFPRAKVCAGWITPDVLRDLEVAPDSYRRGRVLQPMTGFCVGTIGGAAAVSRYGRTVSYGVLRTEFDQHLLERSGARLRLGEALRGLERSGDGWIANGSIRTPLVVAAGGHFCPVARLLGLECGGEVVAAQEAEVELNGPLRERCPVEPEMPELYFCRDLKGYGWCLRKGQHLNVGLGRAGDRSVRSHTEAFVSWLREKGRIPPDLPLPLTGHAYRLWAGDGGELVGAGVLRIGDAAGLAHPKSGEGIRPAVESGLLAAETILEAGGDYRRERLAAYGRRLADRLGEGSRRGALDRLPESWKRSAAVRLLGSRWFSRRVVLDRWFLRSRAPVPGPGNS